MESQLYLLLPIFFVIAIIYSAAGFGGGSSYIAVLALFPLDFADIRLIALVCNIVVVSGSVYLFRKNGFLKLNRVWPLIFCSIPMAFLGGRFKIDEKLFFIVLGLVLFCAALLMLFQSKHAEHKKLPKLSNGLIGGGIGFLSGVVGIGGGIFLSPVLHLTKWNLPKVIAATTALFILVNSIAGLAGQFMTNTFSLNPMLLFLLMLSVFIGGQIGSFVSIKKLDPLTVRKVSGILILFVAVRILYKWLLF